MRLALREAARALEHEDVPIGAVVVKEGEVIGTGHNEREVRADPTAHAEMIALREAARALGSWRVLDAVLYVTLEPCAMCAGAIVLPASPAWCSAPPIQRPAPPAACSTCSASPGSTTGPRSRAACWPRSRRTCCVVLRAPAELATGAEAG